MTQGFPIGRMWLDIEQDPAASGQDAHRRSSRPALDTCNAQGTADVRHLHGLRLLEDVRGQHARVRRRAALVRALQQEALALGLADRRSSAAGSRPWRKQFQTAPLCGAGGVDWDIMQVSATPTVTVDRTLPPDTHAAPVAPSGLFPADGLGDPARLREADVRHGPARDVVPARARALDGHVVGAVLHVDLAERAS